VDKVRPAESAARDVWGNFLTISRIVLVAAPGAELRRSIVFALEADGYVAEAHASLNAAMAAPSAANCVCFIVDENALDGQTRRAATLKRLGIPVILLVDRIRTIPRVAGMKVLTKPMLGQSLLETVRATAAGAPAAS
jgi:DNA-binding response OmpR family regulator